MSRHPCSPKTHCLPYTTVLDILIELSVIKGRSRPTMVSNAYVGKKKYIDSDTVVVSFAMFKALFIALSII